jgi:HPt (histidine-containing phosphotransfer) domain-containing protein
MGGGDHPRLQSLAHNLKSSAAYVGAFELSAAAHRLEQDLRNGRAERLAAQVPGLVSAAETVLAALSELAAAVQPAQRMASDPAVRARLARLLARLQAHLHADDARAEDVLAELDALLAGSAHGGVLAELRRAVHELEYAAALAPLAALAADLELNLEDVS